MVAAGSRDETPRGGSIVKSVAIVVISVLVAIVLLFGDFNPASTDTPQLPRPGDDTAGRDGHDAEAAAPGGEDAGDDHAMEYSGSSPKVSTCSKYYINPLLCHFLDIDFIEFVQSANPKPKGSKVVDIGVYTAGEMVVLGRNGYTVDGYEPNPHRFDLAVQELDRSLTPEQRQRTRVHPYAVSDNSTKLYFQRAGVDSHIYFPEDTAKLKPNTVVVEGKAINEIVTEDTYFVKIDTQGFDTRILDNLLGVLEANPHRVVSFIQFEFTPLSEVNRAGRTAADHVRTFRRLIDAGYDVYMGAVVQAAKNPHGRRRQYGTSPLHMLVPSPEVPTCIEAFVKYMHDARFKPVVPGKVNLYNGAWLDMLAVRRLDRTPYYRHRRYVLARK